MPNAAHNPRSPPTADEKAEKMRRAQDPDLAFAEALLQARQRIQRTHSSRGELQENDRKKKSGEGKYESHKPTICLGFGGGK